MCPLLIEEGRKGRRLPTLDADVGRDINLLGEDDGKGDERSEERNDQGVEETVLKRNQSQSQISESGHDASLP